MSRALRLYRPAAVLAAAALGLAACGGSDTPSASTTTGTGTGSPSASQPAPPPGTGQANGELVVGTLLPQTGDLSYLGPPEFAGVHQAVTDINAAGGVLGKPVRFVDSDSGDTKNNIASQSVDRLFSEKADAIVGAASSSVSLTVLDKITGAGVVQFSPANTSQELTTAEDRNLYFRTAPPDKLQGGVLANEIAGDGNESVAILARQDSYGTGLADRVEEVFKENGGDVPEKIIYDPAADTFSGEVSRVKSANPDAIAVIAFAETSKIIPELVKQGLGPDKKKIYFVDGNLANNYEFPKGTLQGVKGTLPGAQSSVAFRDKLKKQDAKLTDYSYGPESYDATLLIALAAIKAKSDAGQQIAEQLVGLSKDGEKCTDFAACKKLLDDGKDIDYDGASGPVSFDQEGDPAEASIGIYQYGADNKYTFTKAVKGKVE
jgi:ABC-type branched-subunit amino acid transport system substrate-binding protein